MHANVFLHIGLFDDVLPAFKEEWKDKHRISFLHVDCDIYSSTKSIFDYLGDWIGEGTIIIFDEYYGYNDWKKHEFKAFQEYIAEMGYEYEYLAYNQYYEQVVVRIK